MRNEEGHVIGSDVRHRAGGNKRKVRLVEGCIQHIYIIIIMESMWLQVVE